jgi:hypothetical protein
MDTENQIETVAAAVEVAAAVLGVFESVYPTDDRPRTALNSVRDWLLNPTIENGCLVGKTAKAAHAAFLAAKADYHASKRDAGRLAAHAARAAAYAGESASAARSEFSDIAAGVPFFAAEAAAEAAAARK